MAAWDEDPETYCELPELFCGAGCVDVRSNGLHCGACGQECPDGSFCVEGSCAATCSASTRACGLACVDVTSDPDHCGGCDMACPEDRACRGGACVCPEGYSECDGACIDTADDPLHCGLCGRSCEADETCDQGSCVCAGESSETECNNGQDEDCDGLVDCADPDCAGESRPCEGRCGTGREVCGASGSWGACEGGDGSAEICGDGIDQDCSGADLRRRDSWETNDTCGQCERLGGTDPSVSIRPSFDSVRDPVDCFKFRVNDTALSASERIVVQVDGIPSGHNYDVYLYDGRSACDARRSIARSTNGGNGSERISWRERFASNDSGTYYVRVVRRRGYGCNTRYRLRFDGLKRQ